MTMADVAVVGTDRRWARPIAAEAAASISLVIPTLNEAQNLPWVLERIPGYVDEVVLVDGHSTDDTVHVAEALYQDLVVVREPRRGKGAALRAGFQAACGDFIVMIDADGSMDPDEITRYLALMHSGFDVVKGSRFVPGGGSSDLTRVRRLGNRMLLRLVNRIYRTRFTDLCYGFLAIRRSALSALALQADGFEIETEIVVRAARASLRVCEVPSFELERRSGTSNLRSIRDGFRVLGTLLKHRFREPAGAPRVDCSRSEVVIDLTDVTLAGQRQASSV